MGKHMNMELLVSADTHVYCTYTHLLSLIKTIKTCLVICMHLHDWQSHSLLLPGKNKSSLCLWQDVSLVTITSWLITRWHLGGKTAKRKHEGDVEHTQGGECLFCIPECLDICVYSCGLKAKKKSVGVMCTRREVWALPHSIWHKGASSYYACWQYLHEIRFGPGR